MTFRIAPHIHRLRWHSLTKAAHVAKPKKKQPVSLSSTYQHPPASLPRSLGSLSSTASDSELRSRPLLQTGVTDLRCKNTVVAKFFDLSPTRRPRDSLHGRRPASPATAADPSGSRGWLSTLPGVRARGRPMTTSRRSPTSSFSSSSAPPPAAAWCPPKPRSSAAHPGGRPASSSAPSPSASSTARMPARRASSPRLPRRAASPASSGRRRRH